MANEVQERIAAAVYESQRDGRRWADAQPDTKSDYLEDAKVAYQAITASGGATAYDDLRAKAKAARDGETPWEHTGGTVWTTWTVADPSDPTGQTPMQEQVRLADTAETTARFFVAAQPDAILALLDEHDALVARLGGEVDD